MSRLARFDRSVDRGFEPLRHRALADWVFYPASAAGEHSLVWFLLAGARALRATGPRDRRAAARAAVGLAVEWTLVNGALKSLVRRRRPDAAGARPLYLRVPRSSSFPSGHASAAAFAMVVLGEGDPWWPAYAALALVIAASRVHVRIHHASDVLAGLSVGLLLGALARHVAPLPREPGSLGSPHDRRPSGPLSTSGS
ncbi:MAG: phosphatase PAP2 family protein [Acidimicrobiales bacterium]|nr:phosphatase PAP2 family protein [Acidimicrobiales bacterium]